MKTQPAQSKRVSSRQAQSDQSPAPEDQVRRRRTREQLAESSTGNLADPDAENFHPSHHQLPLEPETEPSNPVRSDRRSRRSPSPPPPPEPVRPPQESLQLPQFAPVHASSERPTAISSSPDPQGDSRRHPPIEVLQQQIQSGQQYLDAAMAQINQLSTDLETALFDLKAISTQVNQDRRSLRELTSPATTAPLPPICEYTRTALPRVKRNADGTFRLVMRRIDLLKPEREAASTAQFLRNLTQHKRHQPDPEIQPSAGKRHRPTPPSPPAETSPVPPQPLHRQQPWRWLKRWLRLPRKRSALITDASIWIISSAILRIGLEWVLAAYPALWMPIMLLLLTPAMVIAYQMTFMAQSGLILGYRLLLLLIGLLLGGRL